MQKTEAVKSLKLVKITATYIGVGTSWGMTEGIYEPFLMNGDRVIFANPTEDWRERGYVWIYLEGSRRQMGIHHLDFDKQLSNVRYEFAEVE